MELVAYGVTPNPLDLTNGKFVTGYTSALWTERYRLAGEFKIIGPLSSDLKTQLPLGSLMSHTNSYELMYVENHLIKEERDKEPTIEVSGRSIEAWLENRVVGMDQNWVTPSLNLVETLLPANPTWLQAEKLINDHIVAAQGAPVEGVVTGLEALSVVSPPNQPTAPSPSVERLVKRGSLYTRLLEILIIDDLGIRSTKKNAIQEVQTTKTMLYIYYGTNRTSNLIFSTRNGSLDRAEYLFTTKISKNAALVTGKWVEARTGTPTGYSRREMFIEATDIDDYLETPPALGSATRNTILSRLDIRGKESLYANNAFVLVSCDIAPDSNLRYRTDYFLGDLVQIQTGFGGAFPMRITEYTEIEDEIGNSGHPTFEFIEY